MACYVDKSLRIRLLAALSGVFTNSPEFSMLEVGCPGAEFLMFTTVYRRPKAIRLTIF